MEILAPLSPITADGKLRPKSGRKPLQPKNCPSNLPVDDNVQKIKLKQQRSDTTSNNDDRGKENRPMCATPVKAESLDASLAEELSAVRKKLERLRWEREKTEKMLRERDLLLDEQMMELEKRGEAQKELELEVDRLYRLKQLKLSCMV